MGDVILNREQFQKGWAGGLPETPCGAGSKLSNTKEQRMWIAEIIKRYTIKSIADIGAGDLNWISHMDLSGIDYRAYDLIPRADGVEQFDIVNEIPQKVDMLMCMWVLNHLPKDDCRKAINNLKASGSRFLMMTDRPIWREEQPEEIELPYIEELALNQKGDRIILACDLWA